MDSQFGAKVFSCFKYPCAYLRGDLAEMVFQFFKIIMTL